MAGFDLRDISEWVVDVFVNDQHVVLPPNLRALMWAAHEQGRIVVIDSLGEEHGYGGPIYKQVFRVVLLHHVIQWQLIPNFRSQTQKNSWNKWLSSDDVTCGSHSWHVRRNIVIKLCKQLPVRVERRYKPSCEIDDIHLTSTQILNHRYQYHEVIPLTVNALTSRYTWVMGAAVFGVVALTFS